MIATEEQRNTLNGCRLPGKNESGWTARIENLVRWVIPLPGLKADIEVFSLTSTRPVNNDLRDWVLDDADQNFDGRGFVNNFMRT